MKTTIDVNGKPVEIELTSQQVEAIKKASINPIGYYKTWADICEAKGIDPIKSLPFQSPTTKLEVFVNGAFKLAHIHEVFNMKWEPDYANSNERKYRPWHDWVASRSAFVLKYTDFTSTASYLGSRLCTDTDEKTVYIAKTFSAEWNEFLNPQI